MVKNKPNNIFYNLIISKGENPPFVVKYELESGTVADYKNNIDKPFKGKVKVFTLNNFSSSNKFARTTVNRACLEDDADDHTDSEENANGNSSGGNGGTGGGGGSGGGSGGSGGFSSYGANHYGGTGGGGKNLSVTVIRTSTIQWGIGVFKFPEGGSKNRNASINTDNNCQKKMKFYLLCLMTNPTMI